MTRLIFDCKPGSHRRVHGIRWVGLCLAHVFNSRRPRRWHSHANRTENTPARLRPTRQGTNLASEPRTTCPRMTKSSLTKKNRAAANENSARAPNRNEPIRQLKEEVRCDVINARLWSDCDYTTAGSCIESRFHASQAHSPQGLRWPKAASVAVLFPQRHRCHRTERLQSCDLNGQGTRFVTCPNEIARALPSPSPVVRRCQVRELPGSKWWSAPKPWHRL